LADGNKEVQVLAIFSLYDKNISCIIYLKPSINSMFYYTNVEKKIVIS